jgi:hypothetical protein
VLGLVVTLRAGQTFADFSSSFDMKKLLAVSKNYGYTLLPGSRPNEVDVYWIEAPTDADRGAFEDALRADPTVSDVRGAT